MGSYGVCTRPCSGRRAGAVLREASRPHLILYSRRLFTGLDGSRGGSTFVQRKGGCGKKTGYERAASSHHRRASFCLALVAWRTTSAHCHFAMASAHPPDPHSCIAWSGQCFTHCASSQAAPFTGGCCIACPSRYFPCVGVCTRPCSGRRAGAVLREASRPHLILYSRRLFTGLDGSRGGSTFVQRKGGCGKKTGYERAASSHHRRASFCLALVAWRTTSAHCHFAMASAHPPDPHSCIAWSGQCFTHCASSQAAPFTGGCSFSCPSRYCTFRVWACVPVRVQGAAP